MSRRDSGLRARDAPRDGRPDMGRDTRYPPPPHRERTRGDGPPHHRGRMRGDSPPPHRDRMSGDSRGHEGHRESPPRRRVSRSPIRNSRHRLDEDFHTFQARSPDGHRRRSLELHPHRDSSRERRMRSPRMSARATPPARSPRLPMRPGSPRLPMRPGSLRVPMRPGSPRVPMSRPPQLAAVLDRREEYVDRHAREAMLTNSRNGTVLGMQVATPFSSHNAVKGVGGILDSHPDESLSSYGMLVPRSIVLEDGTVRTFYSLPPDPLSNSVPPSTDDVIGGKLFPPYAGGLTQYSAEHANLRYVSADKFTSVERSRGDYIATQDQRFTDRKLSGQNQYIAGDRSLSGLPEKSDLEHSTNRRERPQSPYQNAIDGSSQRRSSRSPLRDGVQGYGRDGVINSLSRDSYTSEFERSARRIAMERRGSTYDPEISARGGLSSPRRHGLDEDFRGNADRDRIGYTRNPREDELLRAPEEGRLALQRRAPSVYDPPETYPRETGLVRSSEHRDILMYEQSNGGFRRQTRSPPREASRHDKDYPQQSDYRSDMQVYPSPRRNARLSPRRMRSLTPPNSRQEDLHEDERRFWKRKYAELGEDPPLDGKLFRPREPEFKRRERDWDTHHDNHLRDRRPSGWDRQDGYFERRPEREEDKFNHGNQSGRRPWGERGGSPRFPRRYSSYLKDDRRQNDFNNRDEYLQSERPNRPIADKTRLQHGSDMQRDTIEQDEQQIAPDLPEDSAEFKQQAHRAFMKYAKALNENTGQRKKYEEQGKAGMLLCLACSRLSKPFVDTHSLVMHTLQSKKRGVRAEHSGLCKAICTVMGWSSAIEPTGGKSYQNITAEEARANKEDLILWPPAVVVHNVFSGKMTDGPQEGAAEFAVRELLKDSGLSFERTKVAAGRQGTVIIKYLATFSCLHEAEHLHKHFASSSHGRDDWLRVGSAKKEPNADVCADLVQEEGEKKRVLYGYLALAHDLDKVDLDARRRCVIRSRKEIEAIAGDTLTSNKSSD